MSEPQEKDKKVNKQFDSASRKAAKAASAYESQTTDGRLWFGILALTAGIIGSGMLFSDVSDAVRWIWFAGLLFFSLSALLYLAYTLLIMYKSFETVKAFDKYEREHKKFEENDVGSPNEEKLGDLSKTVKDFYEDYLDKPSKLFIVCNIPTFLLGFYASSVVSLALFIIGSLFALSAGTGCDMCA